MYYLKNKYFTRWAKKQGIEDSTLIKAIEEFNEKYYREHGVGINGGPL